MKNQTRNFVCALSLFTLLLWGCSGPPPSDLKPETAAPAAAPAAPAPAAEPAPATDSKNASNEAVNQKAKAARPASQPASQGVAAPAPVPDQTAANLPPEPPPAPMPPPPPPQTVSAPPPPPPPPPEPTSKQVSVPVGTQVYIRMIDSIESDKAHVGDSFRASLDRPIVVDNLTIAPKNVDVSLKLVDVQSAGKLSGTSELKVQLDKIYINKKPYDVATNIYSQSGASEGQKAARNVGVGAAVGGILGGILGGGKGAVIGAGAGGGGGAAVSKGQQIRIDSETQLVFKLENPLDVTVMLQPSQGSTRSAYSGGPATLTPPPDSPPTLQRSSPSAGDYNSLSGTWSVATDALLPATMRLVLRQNGNSLQGSISNPNGGGGTVPIQGTVSGNYITFSTLQQAGYGGPPPIQFSGAVNGDSIDGTFTMPVATNNGGFGGGFPGAGRGRTTRTGQNQQAHWNAQRAD